MSLLEFLDRTGKHASAEAFEKYKNDYHNYSEWEVVLGDQNENKIL